MGLFKNEAIAKGSPFRTGALKTETDVQTIVFEWVHWYNNERLHSALDHQKPEEHPGPCHGPLTRLVTF
ncbi:integrase core domain-containing protein [Arthrobacter sp. TMT4-20]